ncbi:MAG: hypothetical protein OEZ04_06535 [Nitrospinota bacterium]|nr:hypothetical protein [Nitrospinota bacterium]
MDGLEYYHDSKQIASGAGWVTRKVFPIQILYDPPQSPPFEYPIFTNRPLYQYTLAASFLLFGASNQSAALTCYFFYFVAGAVFFFLLLRNFGALAAYCGAMIFCAAPLVMSLAVSNHTDMAYLLFLIVSMFGVFTMPARRLWMISLCFAALFMLRPNGLIPAFVFSAIAVGRIILSQEITTKATKAMHGLAFSIQILVVLAAMLAFNQKTYGAPFRFYDTAGEHISAPVKTDYMKADPPKNRTITGWISLATENLVYNLRGEAKLLITNSKSNPLTFIVFFVGAFWIPALVKDRLFRSLWLTALAIGLLQFLPVKGFLAPRIQAWSIPFLCCFSAVMFRDIFSWIKSSPFGDGLKASLAGLVVMALLIVSAGRGMAQMESMAHMEAIEVKYQEQAWRSACQSMGRELPENSVIISRAPVDWFLGVCSGHFSIQKPSSADAFLGVIKKMRTDNFFYMPWSIPIFHAQDQACELGKMVGLEAYTEPFHQSEYFCVWKVDAAKIRRDFASRIASLP